MGQATKAVQRRRGPHSTENLEKTTHVETKLKENTEKHQKQGEENKAANKEGKKNRKEENKSIFVRIFYFYIFSYCLYYVIIR